MMCSAGVGIYLDSLTIGHTSVGDMDCLVQATDFLSLGELLHTLMPVSCSLKDGLLTRRRKMAAQNISDYSCRLAPHKAVSQTNSVKVLQSLFSLGCTMSAVDDEGRTAAHYAVEWSDVESLRTLQELGCPMGAQDRAGRTALHTAAEFGDVAALQVLHELGCPVNAKDLQGKTAAHVAVEVGDIEVFRVLKELGCPVEEEDNEGNTAEDLATSFDDDAMLHLLREATK